jgi:peptidoglycan hydrolase-like protein with peptidoglycan-binding domain
LLAATAASTAFGIASASPALADHRFGIYHPVPVVFAPPPAPVIVRPAVDRSLTFAIQNELGMAGYNPGPPDGLFGPRTSYAIAAYQQHNGLPADGMVSVPLLDHLRARRSAAASQAAASQAPLPPVLARPAPNATSNNNTTANNTQSGGAMNEAAPGSGDQPICRQYQQPGKTEDGKDITTTGTACLQKDGTWKPSN